MKKRFRKFSGGVAAYILLPIACWLTFASIFKAITEVDSEIAIPLMFSCVGFTAVVAWYAAQQTKPQPIFHFPEKLSAYAGFFEFAWDSTVVTLTGDEEDLIKLEHDLFKLRKKLALHATPEVLQMLHDWRETADPDYLSEDNVGSVSKILLAMREDIGGRNDDIGYSEIHPVFGWPTSLRGMETEGSA